MEIVVVRVIVLLKEDVIDLCEIVKFDLENEMEVMILNGVSVMFVDCDFLLGI